MANVLKTGLYSLGSRGVNVVVALVTLAIIGRLIPVEDFGLFSIVLIFRSILAPFIDFALEPSYIKLEKADDRASAAFFTLNFYISIVAAALMFALSWTSEAFFNNPELQILVSVFSITVFFSALSGQPAAILKRNKQFDRVAKIEVTSVLTGSVAVCLLAYLGLGVWALILRALIESLTRTILMIRASSIRLALSSPGEILRYADSIRFAGQIVLSRLPNRVLLTLDKILIGRFLDAEALGFYSRTQQLAQMTDTNLGKPLTSPALAYLARIRNGVTAANYCLLFWIVFSIAGLACLFLLVTGESLLPLLMGQQWQEAGVILELLGIWGIGKLMHTLCVLYHINEKKMHRWFWVMLLSIPVTYYLPFRSLLADVSLFGFTSFFAYSYAGYWFVVFFALLFGDRPREPVMFYSLMKFLVIVAITLKGTWLMQAWLNNVAFVAGNAFLKTIFTGCFLLLLYVLAFLVFARRETVQILQILKKT